MCAAKSKPILFRILKYFLRLFYPKTKVKGLENIPSEPCIIVGNHAQMHGPIVCELYLPDNYYTWCAAEMMSFKEVPHYAYKDFWSQKSKYTRPFFKALAYIIAPLSVLVFNNARTVAVRKDKRIVTTFRNSVSLLKDGNNLVIFPEHDVKYNNIIYDFQEGFVDIAKLYYKRTGKELSFVPLYIAPKLHSMYLGKPIKYCCETPIKEEARRVCDCLMDQITDIAASLPPHTVIPYRNISKKLYPTNVPKEVKNEEARS